MTTSKIALAAWVLTALGIFGTGNGLAAEDEVTRDNAVVKAEGADSLKSLRAFDSEFRNLLKQKNIPEGDVECVGCEALDGKGGSSEPTELSYFFPADASGIAMAVLDAWRKRLRAVAKLSLTFRGVPNCNQYPQPCYYRQICRANPTPYCSKNSTGACLPGCL